MVYERCRMVSGCCAAKTACLHARRQGAAVVQSEKLGVIPGLPLDDPFQRQAFTAVAVAHPVGQQVGRDGRVADQPAMRAAVTEAEKRLIVLHHLQDDLVVALRVVGEWQEDQFVPVPL